MKKIIIALMLLLVLVASVVSCGKDETISTTTEESIALKEPIYDTDDGWGPLVPMQPVSK